MNKETLVTVVTLTVVFALLMAGAAGCARPKPESRTVPTPELTLPAITDTPQLQETTAAPQSTVITTTPGDTAEGAETPTTESSGEATPTPVVITPSDTLVSSPEAGEGSSEWFLYTISWGDTLYSLAARYNTTVEAITSLNGIATPDQIQTGMQIKIPRAGATTDTTTSAPATGTVAEYVVKAGDDLNSISRQFGVSIESIVQANGLANPDFIYAGQKLVIPASPAGESPAATPSTSGGKEHVVKPGESIDMIAAMYGTTREAIVAANTLANPNWIYVGQVLKIP